MEIPPLNDKIINGNDLTIEDSPPMEETKANAVVEEVSKETETPVAETPAKVEETKEVEPPKVELSSELAKNEKFDEILQKFVDLEQITKSQDEKIEKLTEAISDLKKTIVALSEVSTPSLTKALLENIEEPEEDEPWYARFGQKVGGQ